MSKDEVMLVLRATLAVMDSLANRTRTQADNLIVAILKSNEERLVNAVLSLVQEKEQPPSSERAAAALAAVGIRV
jgi:hypothetical protein